MRSEALVSVSAPELTSAGDAFEIANTPIDNLDGFGALVSVPGQLYVAWNPNLPDCEVCELAAQLTTGPATYYTEWNLADSCTPVPDSCP